jgi:pimeloyl-ACP methyl ester carboxylesterase
MTQILNHRIFGEPSQEPTLIIAHGLFGSQRNWQGLARNLSVDRQVITVDMRNHAGSFWSDNHSYFDLADDFAAFSETIEGPFDLLGHSMGGKAAMVFALRNPARLNRLIVADIAPVAYLHDPTDNIKVMQSLDIEHMTRRSEAEKAMETMVPEAAVRSFIAQSLVIEETGNRWLINLDALQKNMADIVGFPTDIEGRFDHPVAFIRGAMSDYVRDSYQPAIKDWFPNAQIVDVPNAGHWVHAENPRAFLSEVRNFLANT